MRLSIPAFALAASVSVFALSIAGAQTAPAPPAQPPFAIPPFKNLKVLPKDIGRADLIANMKFFSQALGVRCTYCHVGEEGKPLSTFDFASDAKAHKATARDMIRFVQRLNTDLPGITGDPSAKVSCYTCHRGSDKPATEIPLPATPPAPPAPPAKAERGSA